MLLVVLLAPSAAARDIFVDNVRGSDRADGTTAATACRTIRRGLELAQRGDRIVVENTGEPYRESLTLQAAKHSGTSHRPFELIGNGAILDGSLPVPDDAWGHYRDDLYRFRPVKKRHGVLYLNGKPAQRRDATDRTLPALEPLQWCLFRGEVYFRTEASKLPRHYDLRHTVLPVGITVYETRHVVIRDLVVQGFQLDGVNAHDGATQTSLIELVCRGNGRSGISVGGASRVKIVGCLVGDNGAAQVRTEGFCKTELIRCDLLDNTAPPLVRSGGKVTIEE